MGINGIIAGKIEGVVLPYLHNAALPPVLQNRRIDRKTEKINCFNFLPMLA
jgi:hypothetical protein